MPADVEITHALFELGAATLGESGARAMRARIHAGVARCAPRGAGVPGAVHDGRQPGDPRRGRARAERATRSSSTSASFRELGYWGEVLTTAAQARGLAGLVIDGGVRDVTEIQAHGFPVFSSMIALRGATKSRTGAIGARSSAAACSSSRVTGSWVTPTAWSSCRARRSPT